MDNPRKEEEELTAKTWSLASWDRSQVPGWTWVRSSIIPGWKGVTGQQRTEVTGHILALAQKTSLTVRRLCSNNWKDLVSAPSCWGRRWCRGWEARPSPATGSCCTAPWSAPTTPCPQRISQLINRIYMDNYTDFFFWHLAGGFFYIAPSVVFHFLNNHVVWCFQSFNLTLLRALGVVFYSTSKLVHFFEFGY